MWGRGRRDSRHSGRKDIQRGRRQQAARGTHGGEKEGRRGRIYRWDLCGDGHGHQLHGDLHDALVAVKVGMLQVLDGDAVVRPLKQLASLVLLLGFTTQACNQCERMHTATRRSDGGGGGGGGDGGGGNGGTQDKQFEAGLFKPFNAKQTRQKQK